MDWKCFYAIKLLWVEGIRGETLVHLIHISYTSRTYISYISYIRPFLVVVLQQQHVKNVTINIARSVGQTHAQNLRGPAERDLLYIAWSEGNLDGN